MRLPVGEIRVRLAKVLVAVGVFLFGWWCLILAVGIIGTRTCLEVGPPCARPTSAFDPQALLILAVAELMLGLGRARLRAARDHADPDAT
jgi:hypothetical protein